MKSFLVNQFNLEDIEHFNADKCSDTLAFLRYILKRAETQEDKEEINIYMSQVEKRCQELKTSNSI